MQYAIATGILDIDPIPSLRISLRTHKDTHRSTILEPLQLGKLLMDMDNYRQKNGYFAVHYALQIMPYIFVRPSELINSRWEQVNFETCEWLYTVSQTDTLHVVPLALQVMAILEKLKIGTGNGELPLPNKRDYRQTSSEVTLVVRMGYTQQELCIHGFRATARMLEDEALRERYDLIEHQLAHMVPDPNGRAYNRAEYIEERRGMMKR